MAGFLHLQKQRRLIAPSARLFGSIVVLVCLYNVPVSLMSIYFFSLWVFFIHRTIDSRRLEWFAGIYFFCIICLCERLECMSISVTFFSCSAKAMFTPKSSNLSFSLYSSGFWLGRDPVDYFPNTSVVVIMVLENRLCKLLLKKVKFMLRLTASMVVCWWLKWLWVIIIIHNTTHEGGRRLIMIIGRE